MGPLGGGYPVLGSVGGQICTSTDNWFRNHLSGSSRHTHHNSPSAGSHGIYQVVPCTQHPYGVPRRSGHQLVKWNPFRHGAKLGSWQEFSRKIHFRHPQHPHHRCKYPVGGHKPVMVGSQHGASGSLWWGLLTIGLRTGSNRYID